MKQNTTRPSVIEKFRKQRQHMKKLLLAFILVIAVGLGVPLILNSFSSLQSSPVLKVMVMIGGGMAGIMFLVLVIEALFNQRCPVCRTPVGEELWTIQYCSHCGTKLTGD